MRRAKTHISLGVPSVWSESLLFEWTNPRSLATHWALSEDSEQTGRMPRLIWVFAGRTLIVLVVSCRGSNFYYPSHWCQRRAAIFDCDNLWRSFHCCFIRVRQMGKYTSIEIQTMKQALPLLAYYNSTPPPKKKNKQKKNGVLGGYTVFSISVIPSFHDSVIPKFRQHLRIFL